MLFIHLFLMEYFLHVYDGKFDNKPYNLPQRSYNVLGLYDSTEDVDKTEC